MVGYSLFWPVLGTLVILFVMFDFYTTTVTVSGSGPLSKRISRAIWQGFIGVHRLKPNHQLLRSAGPCIVLLLILMWFFACWLGWFLIFCGSENSVISAKTSLPASVAERIYYAGYTLTTIGYGDFRTPNLPGQLVSIVSGLNGLFLVTLAITYSIPVVSSSVDKRRLSALIDAMGRSTPEIIDNSFGSGDFQFLVRQLQQLTPDISAIAEKHLAYPVLLYFHGPTHQTALPLTLSRLDEALTVITFAFPDAPRQSAAQIEMSQRIIETFMAILHGSFISAAKESPSIPDIASIDVLKQSPMTRDEIVEHITSLDRRRYLLAYVRADGWTWADVHERGND
jgi:hypothetical protein